MEAQELGRRPQPPEHSVLGFPTKVADSEGVAGSPDLDNVGRSGEITIDFYRRLRVSMVGKSIGRVMSR